jgi:hypothetical protein
MCYNIKMYDPTIGLNCMGGEGYIVSAETGLVFSKWMKICFAGRKKMPRNLG